MKTKPSIRITLTLAVLLAAGVGGWWWSGEGVSAGKQNADQQRRTSTPRPLPDSEERKKADFEELRALVAEDPTQACHQALTLGKDAVVLVAAAWAERDVDAAIQWALSLDGESRESALATIATELASRDPMRGANLALAMAEGGVRNETLAFVMAQWAVEHPEEGLQWTRELDDADLRAAVERLLLPAVASVDPESAARYVADEMNTIELQRTLVPEILQRWAQLDPETAMEWAGGFTDPKLRQQGLDVLLRVWTVQDVEGLEAWWKDQPPGAFRSEVAVAMAGILAATDRPSALAYADSISEPDLRAIAHQKASAP